MTRNSTRPSWRLCARYVPGIQKSGESRFDTNILVRAFASQSGSARRALFGVLEGNHSLLLSSEILQEVTRITREPRLTALHGRTEEDVYEFAIWLRGVSEMVMLNQITSAPIRDRSDIVVLQTALSGDADAICTLDRDFFSPPASEFLAQRGVAVLTDLQLLQRLRQ